MGLSAFLVRLAQGLIQGNPCELLWESMDELKERISCTYGIAIEMILTVLTFAWIHGFFGICGSALLAS